MRNIFLLLAVVVLPVGSLRIGVGGAIWNVRSRLQISLCSIKNADESADANGAPLWSGLPPPITSLCSIDNADENAADANAAPLWSGLPPPIFAAITSIYFTQGTLTLSRLSTSFLLKDTFHLTPSELAAITGIFAIPWTIKPLYGFLTDNFPIASLRRKPYLLLSAVLASAAQFSVSQPSIVDETWKLVVGVTVSSACIAMTDVVADSVVVERSRESNAGNLQSLCWLSSGIGGVIGAFFSGRLIDAVGARGVFGVSAALPLIVLAAALFLAEEPVKTASQNLADRLKPKFFLLTSALTSPSIYKPMLWIFLWQATPNSDGAFFYYLTNTLSFGPDTLGKVKLVTAVSGLIGIAIYRTFLQNVEIKKLLRTVGLIAFPLSLTPLILITGLNASLGIPSELFVLGDDAILTVLAELAFLPLLVLATKICPPGVEGTLFATLMSIFNLGGVVGNEIGAGVTSALKITGDAGEGTGGLKIKATSRGSSATATSGSPSSSSARGST